MEPDKLLGRLKRQRIDVEYDLAVGDWVRARRRAGRALARSRKELDRLEPELSAWLRMLVWLAQADAEIDCRWQLPLWPELERGSAGEGGDGSGRCERDPARGLGVITRDRDMQRLLAYLECVAPTSLPALLQGESGTGKEVVARAIHRASRRRRAAFVPVNCGAMPSELQESELFGHVRGAYTGAVVDKLGLFEAAHGGTLFLDEVGEMEPRAQVKLLRVLESGELRRLGETRTRLVDVRVLAATNCDVDRAVTTGRFREDLLFRLGAVRVELPPLRERRADILPLATHFLRAATVATPRFTPGAERALLAHSWPGNVRELRFVIQRAVAFWERSRAPALGEEWLQLDPLVTGASGRDAAGDAGTSDNALAKSARIGWPGARGIPLAAGELPAAEQVPRGWPQEVPAGETLESLLQGIERGLIAHALAQSGGNRSHAARLLGGLSRTTLIGKMKRYGLFAPPGTPVEA